MDLKDATLKETEKKPTFDKVLTIKPEFSKDEFLREILHRLAASIANINVKGVRFGTVKDSVREVLVCDAKVDGVVSARVKTDRKFSDSAVTYIKRQFQGSNIYAPMNTDSISKKPVTYRERQFSGSTIYEPMDADGMTPKPATYIKRAYGGSIIFAPMDMDSSNAWPTYRKRQSAGFNIYEPMDLSASPGAVTYRERLLNGLTIYEPMDTGTTVAVYEDREIAFSGTATSAVYNNDNASSPNNLLAAIKNAKEDSVVLEGRAEICKNALSCAIHICKKQAAQPKISALYDNVNVSATATVKAITCYRIPAYEVSYTYKGKEYIANCTACGEMDVWCNYPPAEKRLPFVKCSVFAGWFLFFASIAFAVLTLWFGKSTELWPIPLVLWVVAFCIDSTQGHQEATAIFTNIKTASAKNNLQPIGKAEKKRLKTSITKYIGNEKSPAGLKIFAIILAIALTIASLITGYVMEQSRLHSADQINISVVSKSEEYKEEYQYYTNGCYFIYLDYQVEADEIGVERIDVAIYVSDKNGNRLGLINSEIKDFIDAGEEKTITTTLVEGNPDNNAFFVELYNADLDDLGFDVKIKSIKFEDGKYYHSKD